MPELETPPAPETATQAPQGVDAFDDQFKDLDESPAPKAAPAAPESKSEPVKPAPKATPPPEKGKTVEKPVPTEKPKGEPAKEPEPAPGADEFEPAKVATPSELRGWTLRVAKKAKADRMRVQELEAKLAEIERAPKTNGHDPVLTKQLEDLRKRNEEYENELRITRYERSKEYEEKHQKPIKLAESRAQRDIESLIVEQRQKDPDTGEEKVISSRPGVWKDFFHIYNLPRPEARKTARALFGEDADLVIKHYDDIHQRYEDAELAVQDYRKRGKDQEAQTEAQKKQEAQYMEEGWEKANAMIVQKNPEQFDLREDDEEGNELLTKGRNFVNTFMSKDREKYPLPQQILADARIAQWASAHLRDQRDLKKLKAELTEKDKLIEELRGSGPGKPETEKGKVDGDKPKTWEEEFESRM